MSDGIDQLRARVAELERGVQVLFAQTGAADRERDAREAPAVSDEVRSLLAARDREKAVERCMKESGAKLAQPAAALGGVAKELR